MPDAGLQVEVPKKSRVIRESMVLLGIALLLTTVAWAIRPNRLPMTALSSFYDLELPAPVVDLDRAMRFYAEGSHLFVDIRPIELGVSPYIPGAFAIRQNSFEDDLLAAGDFIYPEDPLILYGSGNLQEVAAVASRFIERGYENILIMTGGIEAWHRAGGPVTQAQEEVHD